MNRTIIMEPHSPLLLHVAGSKAAAAGADINILPRQQT